MQPTALPRWEREGGSGDCWGCRGGGEECRREAPVVWGKNGAGFSLGASITQSPFEHVQSACSVSPHVSSGDQEEKVKLLRIVKLVGLLRFPWSEQNVVLGQQSRGKSSALPCLGWQSLHVFPAEASRSVLLGIQGFQRSLLLLPRRLQCRMGAMVRMFRSMRRWLPEPHEGRCCCPAQDRVFHLPPSALRR